MAGWRNGWLLAWLSRGRWARVWVLLAAVTVVLQLVQAGLLVPGLRPQAALALAPVAPPAPVNPDPKVVEVTAAGPTQVSGSLSSDTVWSPHGSPYMVSGLTVPAGVELTLLPGTVVKLAWHAQVNVVGTLLALGDPSDHVVITSDRDDSVMGDSNGDGGATSPAAGDWSTVAASSGGEAVFDYADVRYGGWGTACYAYGNWGRPGIRS